MQRLKLPGSLFSGHALRAQEGLFPPCGSLLMPGWLPHVPTQGLPGQTRFLFTGSWCRCAATALATSLGAGTAWLGRQPTLVVAAQPEGPSWVVLCLRHVGCVCMLRQRRVP